MERKRPLERELCGYPACTAGAFATVETTLKGQNPSIEHLCMTHFAVNRLEFDQACGPGDGWNARYIKPLTEKDMPKLREEENAALRQMFG
jgi:hypothetical protein